MLDEKIAKVRNDSRVLFFEQNLWDEWQNGGRMDHYNKLNLSYQARLWAGEKISMLYYFMKLLFFFHVGIKKNCFFSWTYKGQISPAHLAI